MLSRPLFSEPVRVETVRLTPLVDQLQHAAWLWGQNMAYRLAAYQGQLYETRWSAMRTLGQAVAECLPDRDEEAASIHGVLQVDRVVEHELQLIASVKLEPLRLAVAVEPVK